MDDYGHLACFPDIGSVYYVFIGDITEYRVIGIDHVERLLRPVDEKASRHLLRQPPQGGQIHPSRGSARADDWLHGFRLLSCC